MLVFALLTWLVDSELFILCDAEFISKATFTLNIKDEYSYDFIDTTTFIDTA